jgi:transposase InsO family protein
LAEEDSGKTFLVDTGAAVSVVPFSGKKSAATAYLTGPDSSVIPAWGTVQLCLRFGGQQFAGDFIQAAVSKPILGVDFLARHKLLVDAAHRRVLHAATLKPLAPPSIPCRRSSSFSASVGHIVPAVRELLAEFPAVISDGQARPQPRHGVEHVVETSGQPLFAKARRLDPDKLRAAEAEFRALEAAGIIRRSDSPWSLPLHMVPKKDGTWRPCGDYRRLNVVTQPDRYPLPSLADFANKLHGCRYFSVVDLVKGYHQIPMAARDIPKTAIVTPFGLYEYVYMPFGLRNAAQTFQRLMDRIFRHLPFCFCYLDDHLIASRTLDEHLGHLRQFFRLLSDNGLQVNPAKCVFAAAEVDFLCHRVTAAGISPLPKHVEVLRRLPVPADVKQLQRFLGLINFYRRFLPGIAATLLPLTNALRGSPRLLDVTPAMVSAVEAAKSALVAATGLAHPAPHAQLALVTDASDSHVGAVLQQLEGRAWRPLSFFSQKLSPAQSRYSTFDRELTAVFAALRHFRFVLEGRLFHIVTDHKPLVTAFGRSSPPWSARQQRQLAYITEFTTDVRQTPGVSNPVADALSRPGEPCSRAPPSPPMSGSSTPSCSPPSLHATEPAAAPQPQPPPTLPPAAFAAGVFRLADFAAAQKSCPDVAAMRQSPSLDIVYRLVDDTYLYGDVSTPIFRPLVPLPFRRLIFDTLHNAGHPGRRATKRLVSSRFVWPYMAKQITQWAAECLPCQRAKTTVHAQPPPAAMAVPAHRFTHINIDIVGPLPVSSGFTHLLTIIDRSSRWPEAVPLSTTTAAACASALFHHWISRFGVPAAITSDRGVQFTSSLWSAMCSMFTIRHVQTPAYHPQANGAIERLHRRLKDSLRARLASADWYHHLPWTMLALRAASRDDTSPSPAELLYGAQLVLPGQFVSAADPPPAESFLQRLRTFVDASAPPPALHKQASTANPSVAVPPALLHAPYVLVRHDAAKPPLAPAYDGPYHVLERSPHTFRLQVGDKVDVVATSRLKAAVLAPDAAAAAPPRRGRPPRLPTPAPVPSSPSVPAGLSSPSRRPPKRVSFAVAAADASRPSGRPQRLRRPPDCLSVSSLRAKTWGEV